MTHNYIAPIDGSTYHEDETNDKELKKMYRAIRTWKGRIFYIFFDGGTIESAREKTEDFLSRHAPKGKYKVFYDSDENIQSGEEFSESLFLVPTEEYEHMVFLAKLALV